jgi:hypothetical protein
MMKLVSAPQAVYFFGPGFACNDGVARANIGRNRHLHNRYSTDR